MRRIAFSLLLILPLACTLGFGGQSVPMGALPRSISAPATPPTTACAVLAPASPVTTSAIDTTGATAIVFGTSFYALGGATGITVTDNKANGPAVALTVHTNGGEGSQLLYYLLPTVGPGHTFTISSTGGSNYYASACITLLFGPTVFDAGTDQGGTGVSTTCQTGTAINPGAGSHTIISAVTPGNEGAATPDSGFTVLGTPEPSGGVGWTLTEAYLIQASGSSVQPTWTHPAASNPACSIASFH